MARPSGPNSSPWVLKGTHPAQWQGEAKSVMLSKSGPAHTLCTSDLVSHQALLARGGGGATPYAPQELHWLQSLSARRRTPHRV